MPNLDSIGETLGRQLLWAEEMGCPVAFILAIGLLCLILGILLWPFPRPRLGLMWFLLDEARKKWSDTGRRRPR